MQLTGIRKYLAFLKIYSWKYKLPTSFLIYAFKLAKYEKLTKLDNKIIFSSFVPPFPSKAFDRFVASFGKKVPTAVYMSLTNKCKYNCWHCSNMYRSGEELTSEELIKLIKDFQNLGASVFGFTGGEPLIREELPEIVKAVDDRATTVLFTSGDGFTDKRAKELKEAGLFTVVISLDHFKSEVHNLLRAKEDAFETALEAIKISKKYGFYTVISTVVTKQLLNNIFEFLAFVQKLGVHEVRILEPVPCGALISEEPILDDKDRAKLIEVHKIANKSSKYPRVSAFSYIESEQAIGCTAGIDHIYIDACGNICPCDFTPLSFGNIKEENLEKILERLHKYFDKPREKCFMLENYKEIANQFEGKLPLTVEKSIELCKKCRPYAMPLFYKKLRLS